VKADIIALMKRLSFLVILLAVMTFGVAQPQDLKAHLDEKIVLNVGDTVGVADFDMKLMGVNDDGCGRARECYWIQFRDATFQIWTDGFDFEDITLSLARREDSKRFVKVGEYYLILEEALGYEMEIGSAEFYVTKTLEPYLYEWEKTE
jgi:hypothetical protein